MQGRLQGKRCGARYFLDEVLRARHRGLQLPARRRRGHEHRRRLRDLVLGHRLRRLRAASPDLSTLRLVPWQPGTALVLCDVQWRDGEPVAASPRQVLRTQLDRLAERGLQRVRRDRARVHRLQRHVTSPPGRKATASWTPANQYNVDYSLLGTARIEPLLRRIRNGMAGAGLYVESAKGECNPGQHEIAFRYDEALTTCDNHSIYKTGAKEIAAQAGQSLTFMAKYDEREGNSCHIHISLRGARRRGGAGGRRPARILAADASTSSPASWPAWRELTYLLRRTSTPTSDSSPGSFAPTAVAWGRDNRTCALRVVGHGAVAAGGEPGARRRRQPVPGGRRADRGRPARHRATSCRWNRCSTATPTPRTARACPPRCATRRSCSAESKVARTAFGDEVVEHYLNAAPVELAAFDAAVTDWERIRGFERL